MADILVVDDDDVIRDTLCELLSAGHYCLTAATAEHALALLKARRFDVVLTDVSGHAGDHHFRAERSGTGAEFDQPRCF